jgi:hypothetical protein
VLRRPVESAMFKAVGMGYNRGLGDFVIAYGGHVDRA